MDSKLMQLTSLPRPPRPMTSTLIFAVYQGVLTSSAPVVCLRRVKDGTVVESIYRLVRVMNISDVEAAESGRGRTEDSD